MSHLEFSIVILSVGHATRFKSRRSKLLHPLAGRPLGEYGLQTALEAGASNVLMVADQDAQAVREALARPGVEFAGQKQQQGAGPSLAALRPQMESWSSGSVLVMAGDAPLLRPETLSAFVKAHQKARAALSVLTMKPEHLRGCSRIVRRGRSQIRKIVEETLCTAAQRKIREVSTDIFCISRVELLKNLSRLSGENPQEDSLPADLVTILNRQKKKVAGFAAKDAGEVLAVQDRAQLAQVEGILRVRKAEALMRDGVAIVNPAATYIDAEVEVGPDSVLEPGVSLLGKTRVGCNCTIRPYSTISDSVLGDNVLVRPCSVIVGCEVSSGVTIGPFAHLRDGAVIEQNARIGNFVEVKKSRVGAGTKASHLTYLGDAKLGRQVNVGAGTVTCNYDGEKKNPTVIEDGVFIGSGSMLVAPVRIGKGSYVAAGSTITEDVPAESLGIGRARQINKDGWARRHKQKKKSESGPGKTKIKSNRGA